MSEEFNDLECTTTSFCTVVQNDSKEINFQKISEIEKNEHISNGKNNLNKKFIEQNLEDIIPNNINNIENNEDRIESGFRNDINSNNINRREEIQ